MKILRYLNQEFFTFWCHIVLIFFSIFIIEFFKYLWSWKNFWLKDNLQEQIETENDFLAALEPDNIETISQPSLARSSVFTSSPSFSPGPSPAHSTSPALTTRWVISSSRNQNFFVFNLWSQRLVGYLSLLDHKQKFYPPASVVYSVN